MHDIPDVPLFEEAMIVRELLLRAIPRSDLPEDLPTEAMDDLLYRGVSASRGFDPNESVFTHGIVTDFFRYRVDEDLTLGIENVMRDYIADPMPTRKAFVERELVDLAEDGESVYETLEHTLFAAHTLGGHTTSLKVSTTTDINVAIAFARGVTAAGLEEKDGGKVYILNPKRAARIVYLERFNADAECEKEVCIPAIVLGSEVLGVIDMATESFTPNPNVGEANDACARVRVMLSVGVTERLRDPSLYTQAIRF